MMQDIFMGTIIKCFGLTLFLSHLDVKCVLPHLVTMNNCALTLAKDVKHVKVVTSVDLFIYIDRHE